MNSLKSLGEEIAEINKANGWKCLTPDEWNPDINPYKIPAVLMLITSEISEALEAFRKRDRENFEEELADTFIRLLDCTQGLGIDIESVILDKMKKNRNRGYKHGGKVI